MSFNASHLLPPLIDLMQDPVVNVRLKVLNHDDTYLPRVDAQPQVCAMARDVCIIAQHGCVAEVGEESRLDRVKAILKRLVAITSPTQALVPYPLFLLAVASAIETGT